jgi:RHS repeat-associated protein
VREIVDGQIKSYLIDDRNPTGYTQVVEEIVGSAVNHTYTYGHDLISQDQFDGTTGAWHASFYGYDGHGNVRFLTDETGVVTDTYIYDAFGTLITATGSTNNRYLYSGEQFDSNLGLYYLRARLMNPLTGRFWTADAYEGAGPDPQSLHKYFYGSADPINGIDPSGYFTLVETNTTATLISTMASYQLPMAREVLLRGRELLVDGDGTPIDSALCILDIVQLANDVVFCVNVGKLAVVGPLALFKGGTTLVGRLVTKSPQAAKQLEFAFAEQIDRTSGLVIGRGADLAKPGALAEGEYKLTWLSVKESAGMEGEWAINQERLLDVMKLNKPIGDGSSLLDKGGFFLNRERGLLQSSGWTYQSGSWIPPIP